jgi:hypothetical protein
MDPLLSCTGAWVNYKISPCTGGHLHGSILVSFSSKIMIPVSPHDSQVCAYIPLIYLSQHLGQVTTSSLAKISLDILVSHRRHDKVIIYLPALLATIASTSANCSGVALR